MRYMNVWHFNQITCQILFIKQSIKWKKKKIKQNPAFIRLKDNKMTVKWSISAATWWTRKVLSLKILWPSSWNQGKEKAFPAESRAAPASLLNALSHQAGRSQILRLCSLHYFTQNRHLFGCQGVGDEERVTEEEWFGDGHRKEQNPK